MKAETRAKIKSATQDHLAISDVLGDLALLKNGTVSLVIETNAVNFDLLSEQEQDNKIYAFGGLLNSLNFHIQILIQTERIDIRNYLSYLKTETNRQMSEGLRQQLEIYRLFIKNLIVTNDVLDKNFFIIIPYNPNSTAVVGAQLQKTNEIQQTFTREQKEKLTEQGRIFLYPKRDHILKQLARMGLVGHQLTNDELIELMYSMYNPDTD